MAPKKQPPVSPEIPSTGSPPEIKPAAIPDEPVIPEEPGQFPEEEPPAIPVPPHEIPSPDKPGS